MNDVLLSKYMASLTLEVDRAKSEAFCEHVKTYFGEKVAYYFCFMDCYNTSLFPIAVVGVVFTIARPYLGTIMYMRLLVLWGFCVSVVWSFWFLKSWRRKNNELNFRWKNALTTKNAFMAYPNPGTFRIHAYNRGFLDQPLLSLLYSCPLGLKHNMM
jgi:hypothetical protein